MGSIIGKILGKFHCTKGFRFIEIIIKLNKLKDIHCTLMKKFPCIGIIGIAMFTEKFVLKKPANCNIVQLIYKYET
jgi:hypothetical protein